MSTAREWLDARWSPYPGAMSDDDRAMHAALTAVLDRHKPVSVQAGSNARTGEPQYRTICAHDREWWPCADARDIDAALGTVTS